MGFKFWLIANRSARYCNALTVAGALVSVLAAVVVKVNTGLCRRLPGVESCPAIYHCRGEAFHLLELRAALEQQEVDARFLELGDALTHLFRRADETGA